jgi:hypothetical protein
MPDPMSVEEQEQAARKYVQDLIAQDRAAKAADAKTQSQAQTAVAKDDARLQQDGQHVRRQRQGYTLR